MVEEELQTTIQHRPLRQMVVVQHQQQRLIIIELLGQLIE